MNPLQFLRTVLWTLVVLEVATGVVVGLVPVAPVNRALAGGIIGWCLGAALTALACLAMLRWVEHG